MIVEIGVRIKQARIARGWSQKTLAEKVGVSRQAIVQFENVKNMMTVDTLVCLCDALEVSTDYLLGRV